MKISLLDKLFSQFIRLRAMALVEGCERCLTPKYDIQKEDGSIFPAWKQLQCSHFWGRRKRSVRFDEENATGLCYGCHMYLTSHPAEHYEFFKERLGQERYDLLEYRANRPQKIDGDLITLYLNQKIQELERY